MNLEELKLELLHTEDLKRLFLIRHSNGRGGKAGKVNNVTTSFQIFSEKLAAGRYFSYIIGDQESWDKAYVKASVWIHDLLIKKGRCPYCGDPECTSDHK